MSILFICTDRPMRPPDRPRKYHCRACHRRFDHPAKQNGRECCPFCNSANVHKDKDKVRP